MKRVIPVIVIIVAAFSILYIYQLRRDRTNPHELLISGNIEATEVSVGFRVMGQIAAFPVKEGEEVKAGALIAELEKDLYQAQSEAARAQADAARARWQALKTGARPQELKQAVAVFDQAQAQYNKARKDFERAQDLRKTETITEEQLQSATLGYQLAEAQLNKAKEGLSLVKEGPRAEEIAAAAAQLAAAEQQYRLTQVQLSYCRLVSPLSGIVISKNAEPGDVALPGTVVATLADLKDVWVRGYINETDLTKVKIGQTVDVSVDSAPGKTFAGRISFIASEAEFTPKQVQTQKERVKLVYRVKVQLDNSSGLLKIGMPADARIKL